jgi:hypothetical protein
MTGRDPWADPATQTEPGAPYAGPPPTHPPAAPPYGGGPYGWPSYGPGPYGPPAHGPAPYGPPYGYPAPWGPVPPRGATRPGQVITSAVLAFVQAAMVLIASLYVWFFASLVDVVAADSPETFTPATASALATEGRVLALVQLVSAILLVLAGTLALSRRTRPIWRLLVVAHAVQVLLSVYWAVRLVMLVDEPAGSGAEGPLIMLTLVFAAAPLVGLGMVLLGAGRRWFDATNATPLPTAAQA